MKYKCIWIYPTSSLRRLYTIGNIYEFKNEVITTDLYHTTVKCKITDNEPQITGFENDIFFEKVEYENTKNWKVLIIPDKNDTEKTILKYYENGKIVKEESVRRFREDTYHSFDAIKAVVEKTFPKKIGISEEKKTKLPKYTICGSIVSAEIINSNTGEVVFKLK